MNPLLEALSRRPSNGVAVEVSGRSFSAPQILADVEEMRAKLVREGIDRAGLLAGNSHAWIVTDLACQSAGICLLPMPTFFADAQLLHSLQSVGVDAILTDDPQRVIRLVGAGCAIPGPEWVSGLTLLRLNGLERPALPSGTRKITFTSGSTGAPRGVCLGTHAQLRVASALGDALQLHAPRHLCLLPLSTLLENVGGVYFALLSGGSVIVLPEAETGFSGSTGLDMLSMLRALERHRPTSIILLPQMLVGLVAAMDEGWQPPVELKFAAVGGAKVAAGLILRARTFGLPVFEGYGLSETASVACLNHPGDEQIGSVGRPLSHVDVRLESGEIVIGGNSFLGYVGEPDSWNSDQVMTGDLGELDADGFLHLHGRRKNVLISSFGRNISPEWIESEILLNTEIGQCIVFGDDRPFCTALIVPANSAVEDRLIQGLIDSANEDLPDYARIQRWHRLDQNINQESGLFTDNGRPRRAAIAAAFASVIESLYVEPMRAVSK